MDQDEYRARRAAEKQQATDRIEQVLAELTANGRVPDGWERDAIATALRGCFSGMYRVAMVSCDLALVPPSDRSPILPRPDDEGFSVDVLRDALGLAQFEPAR